MNIKLSPYCPICGLGRSHPQHGDKCSRELQRKLRDEDAEKQAERILKELEKK